MLPSKLAFVDIETTGLGVTRDRIIEIGILRVENGVLVKQFQSLINPEGFVSPFSLQLTGISPEEIESAPTFYGIREKILEMLEDCIFVAHNVRFDYGFLRNEFKRHGKHFTSKHFCTVKLSQTLFPKERKHNLDAIIQRFGFQCEKRHRAFDDAKVLWDFYQRLQIDFPENVLEKALTQTWKKPSLPPSISSEMMDAIPEKSGVYIFYGENDAPLYVGKSVNVNERVRSHFVNDYTAAKEMHIAQQITRIETHVTSGELGALIQESQLIKKLQPLYNRRLRLARKLCVLKKRQIKEGYPEVYGELVDTVQPDDLPQIIGIFRSNRQAKDFLIAQGKEFQLCEKLLGIEKTHTSCFAYRLGLCKGACIQEEKPISYMMRFAEAFSGNAVKKWPFSGPVVISEEDECEETAEYFVVDKWCLLSQHNEHSAILEEVKKEAYVFDVDTYKLLVRFLENKSHWKQIKVLPTNTYTSGSHALENFSDGI